MSEIEKFEYDPPLGFEDSTAYPSTAGSETVTREQIMRPHKQIRNYINGLILNLRGVFGASNIGTSKGENVQNELDLKPYKVDVLTKKNTVPFSPTNDYEPATVKFVKDTAFDVNNADMRKDVYDKNRNNRVDDSDKVNGFTVDRDVLLNEYDNGQIDALLVDKLSVKYFSLTFLAELWFESESGAVYTQRINLEGMNDWDCSMILDTANLTEEQKVQSFENMHIREIETFENYVIAMCLEKPEVDLKIKLQCYSRTVI